jgi:hypothetical protein
LAGTCLASTPAAITNNVLRKGEIFHREHEDTGGGAAAGILARRQERRNCVKNGVPSAEGVLREKLPAVAGPGLREKLPGLREKRCAVSGGGVA